MPSELIQVMAGLVSSKIFATSTLTMLFKTMRTKNVDSFSLSSLVLSNLGNAVYWLYVVSLPCGPIYLLHGFYTVAMVIMLVFYVGYHNRRAVNPGTRANPCPTSRHRYIKSVKGAQSNGHTTQQVIRAGGTPGCCWHEYRDWSVQRPLKSRLLHQSSHCLSW